MSALLQVLEEGDDDLKKMWTSWTMLEAYFEIDRLFQVKLFKSN